MLVPAPESPHWRAAPGIDVTPLIREKVDAVAAIYHAKTRRRLEVTSGRRSPERQADAMYTKLIHGGSLAIYKNRALIDPLQKAWREGRRFRKKRAEVVAAMARVLAEQVERGQFISRHLRGRAFDVRSVGLTSTQRAAFIGAIREVGGMRVIRESRPPHYHVEILVVDPIAPPTPDAGSPDGIPPGTPDPRGPISLDPSQTQTQPDEPTDAPE